MSLYKICAETNVGKVRSNNEDNFFCNGIFKKNLSENNFSYSGHFSAEKRNVAGVFDGMGGTRFGEQASYLAADILNCYWQLLQENQKSFEGEYILNQMNSCICQAMKNMPGNMGSTAVLLVCEGDKAKVFNLGDSRAYLFRSQKLIQLSVDHTEENSMLELQKSLGISCNISKSNCKHILTQHLGIEEEDFLLEPFVSDNILVQKGDIFLLCTDGLTNMLDDSEIAGILGKKADLQEKKDYLMESAMCAGGKDNITVVLLEV